MTDLLSEYRTRLRQATEVIGQLEQALASERSRTQQAIAVVGIGCRFPPAIQSPQGLLRQLLQGTDPVVQAPPRAHPGSQAARDPVLRGATWGAFLDDVEGFDADCFSLSPREARTLDPQQRLLLEVTSDALERAGLPASRLQGQRVGVFVGLAASDYLDRCLRRAEQPHDFHAVTGNGACFAAGRLSFHFGFEGPSLTLDTACSSSLVAVHLAMQSLRRGECDYALAAAANVVLSARGSLLLANSQALSPSGRCRTFDAAADGFARGEGAGAVVLMRQSDAVAQRVPLLALLRGSAVNQDGRSTGLTAPNGLAQAKMLRAALADSRLQPDDIDFVEAHGTGTSLGDPIEIDALRSVFGPGERPLHVGAVKSSLGHLEAAAGMAGLIKTIACLQAQTLPANLHFRHLNPRIRLGGSRLRILDQAVPWPAGPRIRRAGVSAFGLSGTNAHVIVEEAPPLPSAQPAPSACDAGAAGSSAPPLYLLPLSARSDAALRQLCRDYAAALTDAEAPLLTDEGPAGLRNLAYSASLGRTHHAHRIAIPFSSLAELLTALPEAALGRPPLDGTQGVRHSDRAPAPVLVLTGQGAQWAGMGADLLDGTDAFAQTMRRCEPLVAQLAGFSLRAELARPESTSRLQATEVAQPALCCLQIALAAVLREAGVVPAAVVGHSVGELAAAHIAGALTLEQTLALACLRGRVLQAETGLGGMAAVEAPAAQVEALLHARGLHDRVAIAAENDPSACVLAGDAAALSQALQQLSEQGLRSRRLTVDYAFHSPRLRSLVPRLSAGMASLDLQPSPLVYPLYSTVLGQRVTAAALDPDYWLRNVTDRVRFASAIQAALGDGHRLFVELGPHPALTWNVSRCAADKDLEIRVIPTLRRPKSGASDARRPLFSALGALYASGCDLHWASLFLDGGQSIPLPTYPFVRTRYWVDAAPDSPTAWTTTAATGTAADPTDSSAFISHSDGSADAAQIFTWGWRAAPPRESATPLDARGSWLIVADSDPEAAGLAEGLCTTLRTLGGQVRVVDWAVAPSHLSGAMAAPDLRAVLCLAGFDEVGPSQTSPDAWGLLRSGQGLALGQAVLARETRLWLLCGAVDVGQQPAVSALRGLVRVLAREQPHTAGGVLCLPSTFDRDQAVAACLHALSLPTGEYHLRDGGLMSPLLVPHTLPAMSAMPSSSGAIEQAKPILDSDASYLITSGSEGVELLLSEWLARRGARQIVLWGQPSTTVRSDRPPADASSDRASDATVVAQKLAGLGCTLRIIPTKSARSAAEAATEQNALTELVAALQAEGRPLRGVIHAAGQRDDGVFAQQTPDRLTGPLMTKAGLALRLHRATQAVDLRFFVLFASLGGLVGAIGQANYAAANAVLHDLARLRWRQGQPALLLAWTERGPDLGAQPLPTEDGLRLLDAVLPLPSCALAVIPRTVQVAWAKSMPVRLPWPDLLVGIAQTANVPDARSSAKGPDEARTGWASLSPKDAERQLLSEVRRAVDQVLDLPAGQSAPIRRGFFDLGMDSLLGLELRNRLQQVLGISIPSTAIFDHPTIEQLSAHLWTRLATVLAAPAPTAIHPSTGPSAGPSAVSDPLTPSADSQTQQLLADVRGMDEAALSAAIDGELDTLLAEDDIRTVISPFINTQIDSDINSDIRTQIDTPFGRTSHE
ncbi:MAG: acyltransferase domain-containing protein [Myxococcales bacterium]|nr:acyltransferase domain-containing protein [Myxococcales bacterium]